MDFQLCLKLTVTNQKRLSSLQFTYDGILDDHVICSAICHREKLIQPSAISEMMVGFA